MLRRKVGSENVNDAVKSSFLPSFLEAVPEVSAKLKPSATADRKFEEVVYKHYNDTTRPPSH
jgi:hypothetical protein